jgi:hypothetical protein
MSLPAEKQILYVPAATNQGAMKLSKIEQGVTL